MPWLFADFSTIVTAAPGTGSTSLLAACEGSGRGIDLVRTARPQPSGVDAKHATVADLKRHMAFAWNETIVTTTRNPFDYYVAEWTRSRTRWARELGDPSSWVNRVDGVRRSIEDALEHEFVDWIDLVLGDDHAAGQRRRVNAGHVNEATIVLRMEHVDADLAAGHPLLADALGTIPHENRTERSRDFAAMYTKRAAEIVGSVHADDIERFGYSFGSSGG